MYPFVQIAVVWRWIARVSQTLFFLAQLLGLRVLVWLALLRRLPRVAIEPRLQLLDRRHMPFADTLQQDVETHALDNQRAAIQLTGKILAQGLLITTNRICNAALLPTRRRTHRYKVLILLGFLKDETPPPITQRLNDIAEQVVFHVIGWKIRTHRKKSPAGGTAGLGSVGVSDF